MRPRTGRWVERGLGSPACSPRLGQSLSGMCVYVTSVPARPCRCAPSMGTCRVSHGAGGAPFVASFPSPCCWELVVGLAVACVLGFGGDPPHGPLERRRAPPLPGCAGWPAARAVMYVSVCKHPSGGPDAPCCSSVSLPCVSAHMSDRGGSQTQDLASHLRVSFFLAPSRVAGGVKMGAVGRSSTASACHCAARRREDCVPPFGWCLLWLRIKVGRIVLQCVCVCTVLVTCIWCLAGWGLVCSAYVRAVVKCQLVLHNKVHEHDDHGT